ncbi:2-C-methyl-D-erythritol 4-phosphate cytidylyltransferase [uncultured Methanobrevibacter sp.]|uniref:IspD/TarI family cytidylyltransferase n=1 Tax=uncultured Methanobrevibacter sp. TaxID=253161 RepID=UPI0026302D3A|nr:2-C-methyl-D-erythritol 4-phosphate cytidylyltransferase [uncultured Methanobrevibacter sp.]
MIFAAMLAGGIGTRMGLNKPKQFEIVGDKPILAHSIGNFLEVEEIDKIIVSSPKEYIDTTKELVEKYFENNSRIVVIQGGKTRNDTILNSIDYVKSNFNDEDPILITHDAARIFASPALIEKSIVNVINHDAASPVIPAIDVIFESKKEGKLTDIPLRENLVHSQTPQSFKINKFLEIYKDLTEDEIAKLDEAMMLFFLRDGDVKLFEGESSNFKITRNIDLKIAEAYLKEN